MTENATRDIAALLRERVVPPGGTRRGLVVGIERYRDTRLNLRCAAADAKAIFDLMTDPDCGMFPKENVRLLLDEEATRDGIWRSLSALRRSAGENDTVWIYYAGHAAPEESSVYWVTHDADVDDLYGTGLSSDQISKVLDVIRARRLFVLLDCCYAAATAAQKNPTRAVVTADEVFSCFEGHGRITLSSSDGKEKSVELGDVGHGAFTYFLERGLRGEADADGDGVVTADELWSYLRSKVVDASQKAGNPQTPVLLGELRHDFALSLNPLEFGRRRRIADTIRSLVGVGPDQLTTEEGRICLELLRREAWNAAERDLMAEFASLLEGRLRISTLRRLIDDVRETARSSAPASPAPPSLACVPADLAKTDAAAAAKRGGSCEVTCAENFDQLPEKYHWDSKRTLDVINRWSRKYLGVLSNMADRCELLDMQAHGYFVWQAYAVVETRCWTERRKGSNTPNPSGPLEFLARKPPEVPELTPELMQRIREICQDCHGTGEYVCPDCFGQGDIQCESCRGVGKRRFSDGTYSSQSPCDVCHGAKKMPCTTCKGVPRRQCEICRGAGVVAVYPAIEISRSASPVSGASVPGVTRFGMTFTVPLARIEGGADAVPEKAAALLSRFEGAEALRDALAYSPKDKNARITKVVVELRWYPYVLCKMRYGRTGAEFVLGVNCTCGTVFQVQGMCPKGEGFWSWLLGWASRPFAKTLEPEREFMRKQMQSKHAREVGSDCL